MSSEPRNSRRHAEEVDHDAVMDNRSPRQAQGRNAAGILGPDSHSRAYKDRGEPQGSGRYHQMKNQ